MQIQTMKNIDRHAGQILCGMLRGLDLLSPKTPSDKLDDILLIKFWGMGSLILAAPVFKAIRKSHPGVRIHLATLEQNLTMARMLGLADELHPLILDSSPSAVPGNIIDYFARIRQVKVDAVIDLEYLSRFSAIVSYLSGASLRIGFHSWDVWRGNLHNRPVAFSPYWHVTDNFLNLHKSLGIEIEPDHHAELNLDQGEQQAADQVGSRFGIDKSETLIVINPNASTMALERRWPEEYFIELINRIEDQGLGRTALIGAADEADFIASLHQRLKRPDKTLDLAGRLSLAELVGLLRITSLLVTNDSGPLHLADLLSTPTVSFFGPETPSLYGPRGADNTILYKGIDCSPCISIYNAKTVRCLRERPECLHLISVDEALAAVRQRLEGDKA